MSCRIDPRERRARWYWLTSFVLCILALVAAVSMLLWMEQTAEEKMIAIVAAAGQFWQVRLVPFTSSSSIPKTFGDTRSLNKELANEERGNPRRAVSSALSRNTPKPNPQGCQ